MGTGGGVSLCDSFMKMGKAEVEEEQMEETVRRWRSNMKGLLNICQEGLCLSIREKCLPYKRSRPYRPEVN